MNCPRCGWEVSKHGCAPNLGYFDFENDRANLCPLTEAEATRAAQRKAAAVGLWRVDRQRWMCKQAGAFVEFAAITQALFAMRALLRDLGISRPATGK